MLANSSSFTDDELLDEIAVPAAGTYTLRVRPSGSTGNAYAMEIAVGPAGPGPVCPSDSLEQNDTDAAPAALGAGTVSELNLCQSDDDWYAITLAADSQITVDATFSDAEGDIEMQFRDPGGTLVVVADSSSDNETLGPYTAITGGDFLLRVYLNNDDGVALGNDYSLDVSITAAPTCPTDAFEDNDDDTAPAVLGAGTHTLLHVCNSDADYYTIPLAAGVEISIDATFQHAEGDIDLRLYRISNGNQVATAATGADNESLGPYEAVATDDYLLHVDLYNDTGVSVGNSYDLVVTIN